MMPSFSNRIAPVKCSRPSSTSRAMRSISPMMPSKFMAAIVACSRVQFVVKRLPDFGPEDVHQVQRGGLLHARQAAEALDEEAPPLFADSGHLIELAVQH